MGEEMITQFRMQPKNINKFAVNFEIYILGQAKMYIFRHLFRNRKIIANWQQLRIFSLRKLHSGQKLTQ